MRKLIIYFFLLYGLTLFSQQRVKIDSVAVLNPVTFKKIKTAHSEKEFEKMLNDLEPYYNSNFFYLKVYTDSGLIRLKLPVKNRKPRVIERNII